MTSRRKLGTIGKSDWKIEEARYRKIRDLIQIHSEVLRTQDKTNDSPFVQFRLVLTTVKKEPLNRQTRCSRRNDPRLCHYCNITGPLACSECLKEYRKRLVYQKIEERFPDISVRQGIVKRSARNKPTELDIYKRIRDRSRMEPVIFPAIPNDKSFNRISDKIEQ
ncbi:unnamed protein product [Dimorphilus gyrociliatus]|uniref:Uncharacterized protein n=1 Tax=Dimorphilus gyrociliatus TaxID=2664684 RepID=A0A7I8VHW2_9ANNE|nr:unnamed protein product [Dimorphilus gyrociliatus]